MGGGGGSSSSSHKKKAAANKVSAKLFKAKKRPYPQASSDSDSGSDIEIVADFQSPAKKKKIGPKSRIHWTVQKHFFEKTYEH